MANRISTISREFGSGGRTVGKEVAARLGIRCYDSELIQKIAEESGYAEEFIEERVEDARHKSWLANALGTDRDYITGRSTQDYIWQAQRKVILDLANEDQTLFYRFGRKLYNGTNTLHGVFSGCIVRGDFAFWSGDYRLEFTA